MNKIDSLLTIYLSLPKSARRIIYWLQKLVSKYRRVFVSVFSLASWSVIHRATVFRALKKLREVGWLGTMTRPNQTNEYFLDDSIKTFNFEKALRNKVSDGKNQNATPMRHIANNDKNTIYNIGTAGTGISDSDSSNIDGYPSWLPEILRIKAFKGLGSEFRQFIEDLPIPAMIEAVNDCKWYARTGNKIGSVKGLLLSRLKAHKRKVKGC